MQQNNNHRPEHNNKGITVKENKESAASGQSKSRPQLDLCIVEEAKEFCM